MDQRSDGTGSNIVILGGGTAGWMTAAGLRRLLPPDYTITLVESDEIGTVGVGEATLPHIKKFNDLLGLDEADFMRRTGATFKLGIQFVGWDQPGEAYIHPFGAFGEPWGGVEFQHHWLRARMAGRTDAPLDQFSYAVTAANAGVFAHPDEDPGSIRATYSYAYHFDAGRYAALLREWAIERGVQRVEGKVARVERDQLTGDVAALHLERGEHVAGDLFVDCSGFRSLLLGGEMDSPWEDWTHWLPCDAAWAVPTARAATMPPYTRATAKPGGWIWRIPLQHRTGNGHVFSTRFIEPEAARDTLLAALEEAPLDEPRMLRFKPGRRTDAWRGNVIGIGLASGFLEPLESTSIFLIQAAVIDLANLLPRDDRPDPRLAAEFNRLSGMQYDRVRDFLVLHYTANSRAGEPLWDYLRAMPLPDTLADKLDLYRSRGTLPDYAFGLFARDSWLSVLDGQGVRAQAHDPLADAAPIDALAERMETFRTRIAGGVATMPSHAEFLADYCAEGVA
jgi:tryptophan 7-halogenase